MTTKDDGTLRDFGTGATRDTAEGKLLYNKFLSPVVLTQFAKFMNMNRLQSNGKLRDGDNWQKGMPPEVYEGSLARHYHEFWTMVESREGMNRTGNIEMIAAAMGQLFNIMGWTLEWLKENDMVDFDGDEPTKEMRARQEMLAEKQESKVEPCRWCGEIDGHDMVCPYLEPATVPENPEEDTITDRVYPFTFTDNVPVEPGSRYCGDCVHRSLCLDEHPCDCCDEDRSNYSPK